MLQFYLRIGLKSSAAAQCTVAVVTVKSRKWEKSDIEVISIQSTLSETNKSSS